MYRIISAAITFFFIQFAAAATVPGPLVEADWLASNLDKVKILDARADTRSFNGQPVYIKDKKGKQHLVRVGGHIPGAALVDYSRLRGDVTIDGKKVTRMLLPKKKFEGLMQAAGVNQDDAIVVVSKGESVGDMTIATRLYWSLKYYGQDDVAILNGGMAQWILEGRKVVSRSKRIARGSWQATAERKELLATTDQVVSAMKDKKVQLMDNRALGQYLGLHKKNYVYAKGHIPGAKVFPNELLTDPGMPARFTPVDQLRTLVSEMGIDPQQPVVTYCNSGHLASGGWFIMHELLGNKNTRLYDGSMHQWTLEKQPVEALKMEK